MSTAEQIKFAQCLSFDEIYKNSELNRPTCDTWNAENTQNAQTHINLLCDRIKELTNEGKNNGIVDNCYNGSLGKMIFDAIRKIPVNELYPYKGVVPPDLEILPEVPPTRVQQPAYVSTVSFPNPVSPVSFNNISYSSPHFSAPRISYNFSNPPTPTFRRISMSTTTNDPQINNQIAAANRFFDEFAERTNEQIRAADGIARRIVDGTFEAANRVAREISAQTEAQIEVGKRVAMQLTDSTNAYIATNRSLAKQIADSANAQVKSNIQIAEQQYTANKHNYETVVAHNNLVRAYNNHLNWIETKKESGLFSEKFDLTCQQFIFITSFIPNLELTAKLVPHLKGYIENPDVSFYARNYYVISNVLHELQKSIYDEKIKIRVSYALLYYFFCQNHQKGAEPYINQVIKQWKILFNDSDLSSIHEKYFGENSEQTLGFNHDEKSKKSFEKIINKVFSAEQKHIDDMPTVQEKQKNVVPKIIPHVPAPQHIQAKIKQHKKATEIEKEPIKWYTITLLVISALLTPAIIGLIPLIFLSIKIYKTRQKNREIDEQNAVAKANVDQENAEIDRQNAEEQRNVDDLNAAAQRVADERNMEIDRQNTAAQEEANRQNTEINNHNREVEETEKIAKKIEGKWKKQMAYDRTKYEQLPENVQSRESVTQFANDIIRINENFHPDLEDNVVLMQRN